MGVQVLRGVLCKKAGAGAGSCLHLGLHLSRSFASSEGCCRAQAVREFGAQLADRAAEAQALELSSLNYPVLRSFSKP